MTSCANAVKLGLVSHLNPFERTVLLFKSCQSVNSVPLTKTVTQSVSSVLASNSSDLSRTLPIALLTIIPLCWASIPTEKLEAQIHVLFGRNSVYYVPGERDNINAIKGKTIRICQYSVVESDL